MSGKTELRVFNYCKKCDKSWQIYAHGGLCPKCGTELCEQMTQEGGRNG
jgi:Zn finger protein HypA/HybF involved in hydrogenase expression